MLEVQTLGYRIGERWLLKNINFCAVPGEFWVIAGPNGAGKTTLVRLLSGVLTPSTGKVKLEGGELSQYTPLALAKIRACLEQHRMRTFPFTAEEIVMLGRTPHLKGIRISKHDRDIVHEKMQHTGVAELAMRRYPSLSGGEAVRVDLARILAQEPRLLLLDEPTNHLDIRHQYEILRLCSQLTRAGCLVVAVLHDLNLASLFATHMMMLHKGQCVGIGTPEEVLTPKRLRDVYGLPCAVWKHPRGCPWVIPMAEPDAKPITMNDQPVGYERSFA